MVAENAEELDVIELESNLDDAEKPPELPAGVYIGEVQDVQTATSGKGNSYYAVKFVVPQEEVPVDQQDQFEDGAVLFWNRQIKPGPKDRRALYNLRKFVEALGLDTATTKIDPNEWMGCRAKLRVRHSKNPNTGEMTAQIQAVEPEEAEAKPTPRGRAPVAAEPEAPPAGRQTRRAGRGR